MSHVVIELQNVFVGVSDTRDTIVQGAAINRKSRPHTVRRYTLSQSRSNRFCYSIIKHFKHISDFIRKENLI